MQISFKVKRDIPYEEAVAEVTTALKAAKRDLLFHHRDTEIALKASS
ncbi:MAG: hypothetical protein JXB47_21075 [Anaerolineae bacterium]|nr:hypothetical protein [Anaerolineae bacterium]